MSENQNNRNSKPISLHPLTPEEALRRALKTPPPKNEPKRPRKKRQRRKSGS